MNHSDTKLALGLLTGVFTAFLFLGAALVQGGASAASTSGYGIDDSTRTIVADASS